MPTGKSTERSRLTKRLDRPITESKTDPESGLFQKGEHQKCFAYEAHTACDKHNFILEVEVTAGNVHDSVAFGQVYNKVTERFLEIETVVADAAYKTPYICRRVFKDERVLSTAYKRPMTKKGIWNGGSMCMMSIMTV